MAKRLEFRCSFLLMLATMIFQPCLVWCAGRADGQVVAASQGRYGEFSEPATVSLTIVHDIELPWRKRGFRIWVNHWRPDGVISFHAIGPAGQRIDLVPAYDSLRADHKGTIVIDVAYGRRGLQRGHWIIVAIGDSGAHTIETDLPGI